MLKIFKIKWLNNKLKSADINKSYQTVWPSNLQFLKILNVEIIYNLNNLLKTDVKTDVNKCFLAARMPWLLAARKQYMARCASRTSPPNLQLLQIFDVENI